MAAGDGKAEEVSRTFELEGDDVAVIHEDGRVRRSPIPAGIERTTFRNALSAVDVLYRQEGVVPTIDEVHRLWPQITKRTYEKLWAMPEFKEALELRGIRMDKDAGLTELQAHAILLLSDPTDHRNTSTKLRELGISMARYQAWMKSPLFADTLRKRAEDNLGNAIPTALNALIGNVEKGDQRAIEKLLEVSGRYNPAQIEVANARQVVLVMVEAVLKHVPDKAAREAILGELTDSMTTLSITSELKKG